MLLRLQSLASMISSNDEVVRRSNVWYQRSLAQAYMSMQLDEKDKEVGVLVWHW